MSNDLTLFKMVITNAGGIEKEADYFNIRDIPNYSVSGPVIDGTRLLMCLAHTNVFHI